MNLYNPSSECAGVLKHEVSNCISHTKEGARKFVTATFLSKILASPQMSVIFYKRLLIKN